MEDPKNTSNYDRMQELKAFDDTKAGVRGLVENGITKVPRMFINPPDVNNNEQTSSDKHQLVIPVIDLEGIKLEKNKEIVDQVRRAAETYGFFQVVNHGIPVEILDEMLECVRRFNESPKEERSKFYTRETTKLFTYNTNFDLYEAPAANWRDTMVCMVAPDSPHPDEIPIQFRDILMEYSKNIMNLGNLLLELLSEALGLKRD